MAKRTTFTKSRKTGDTELIESSHDQGQPCSEFLVKAIRLKINIYGGSFTSSQRKLNANDYSSLCIEFLCDFTKMPIIKMKYLFPDVCFCQRRGY